MARGRRPDEGEARTEVLKVRLTPRTEAGMQATLQGETRSQFARGAIEDKIRARGGNV